MATVAEKLLTAWEFGQLPDPPDGSQQELVRGEVIHMPPPKGPHGLCCSTTVRLVGNFVNLKHLGHVLCNDIGFITETDPDTVRGVDVAFWSYARLPVIPLHEYIRVAPDLAVEVLSPGNVVADMREKVLEYLHCGVRLVWVIDPAKRSVTVYRSPDEDKVFPEKATLSGEDVLPGFSCLVAELFA